MTASRASRNEPLAVGGFVTPRGQRTRFDLPAALLPTHTQLHLPLTVVNGLRKGPTIWLSAVVHGDELNGLEIIGRVLDRIKDPIPRGAIIAAPVVNVFGFINQSRYMPDRRDLNRSFPGSRKGSLASRMAALFMREVVSRCTHGIDLHTASRDKANLAQVRGDLSNPEARRIARAFDAPVMVHSPTRSGSLRGTAARRGIPVLVFEGGEPQRFNEPVIRTGVRGVIGVLHELGILPGGPRKRTRTAYIERSSWVRARRGGVLRLKVDVGSEVRNKEDIGTISDPFGEESLVVHAPATGIVIGKTNNPVVHGGDALVHVGIVEEG